MLAENIQQFFLQVFHEAGIQEDNLVPVLPGMYSSGAPLNAYLFPPQVFNTKCLPSLELVNKVVALMQDNSAAMPRIFEHLEGGKKSPAGSTSSVTHEFNTRSSQQQTNARKNLAEKMSKLRTQITSASAGKEDTSLRLCGVSSKFGSDNLPA